MWIHVTLEDCSGSVSSLLFTSEVKMSLWGKPNEAGCLRRRAHSAPVSQVFEYKRLLRVCAQQKVGNLQLEGSGGLAGMPRCSSETGYVRVSYPGWWQGQSQGGGFNLWNCCTDVIFIKTYNPIITEHLLTFVCVYYLVLSVWSWVIQQYSVSPRSLLSSERWNNLQKSRLLADQTAGLFSVLPAELHFFQSLSL